MISTALAHERLDVLRPKIKVPLKRRRFMTLAAGFRCADGILVCADREESGDGSKASVDKIWTWKCATAHFVFAAAGTSVIIANLYAKLDGALTAANEATLPDSHADIISGVLRSIHDEYKEFDEWQELVIAASFYRVDHTPVASRLYGTVGNVLQPRADYVCVGGGKHLAQYFCHKLYERWPDRVRAIVIAAFVFRETEDYVDGVGRGTDMAYVTTQHRAVHTYGHLVVKELQDAIPSLSDALFGHWATSLKVPSWLLPKLST